MSIVRVSTLRLVALVALMLPPGLLGASVVFEASGANPAAIQNKVDAFRTALGPANGSGPAAVNGRREINWDGIPAAALDPFNGNFFNSNSPRGLVLSTPGTRLKVSGDPGTPSFLMRDVTAQEWGLMELASFSPEKMFAPIGSTTTDVIFFVPGTTTRATVTGFGAVYVDLDVADASRLEAFDLSGRLIFSRTVLLPGVPSKGLSFLGVAFDAGERIARVRITSGTHPIDTGFMNPAPDGVALDDFIYGEPQAAADAILQLSTIASAIHANGANNSVWRTDLTILNTSGFAANYRVQSTIGGSTKSVTGSIAPGAQTTLRDVIGALGLDGVGPLQVFSDQPLNVSSRTYNAIPSSASCFPGGSFGQINTARSPSQTLSVGTVSFLPGLTQDATARTNIGATNTGSIAAIVSIVLMDAEGRQVGTFDFSLAPGQSLQENQAFVTRANRNNINGGSAKVIARTGSGLLVYASVVDNLTNDPTWIDATR